MANSHPQHRCVFVGNIPYDAKEEQLKEICEEVGPVVSFRLVIDRETGKPKGYGFCEYKDEETALSARRNLQGYEINGRQLRVDFAENDKNTDKGREQGRGGPGIVASVENQKQFGGPAVLGDSSLHQPIGVSAAMTAGTVLAQTLGATQTGNHTNISNQPSVASDLITLHLAKMSRHQLIEVVSDMKAMATQNKEQARQLLLACSPMAKAILQALILLELAPPAMLQMPNIKQAPTPALQPSVQDGVPSQLSTTQNHLGFPSSLQNKVQYNAPDNAVSASRPISMLNIQQAMVSQFPLQPHSQGPQLIHQSQFLQSGNLNVPLMRPQSQGNFSLRPQGQVATSSFMQQVQNPQFQQLGPVNQGPQHVTPFLSGVPDDISKDPRKQVMGDSIDSMAHPSKLARLNDGRPMPSSMAEGSSQPEKQDAVQAPLPPDVESVLLQQVLSLPPERVRLLPPDQQQQIIQLQQMYRQTS